MGDRVATSLLWKRGARAATSPYVVVGMAVLLLRNGSKGGLAGAMTPLNSKKQQKNSR
jgi:hypothetical protein